MNKKLLVGGVVFIVAAISYGLIQSVILSAMGVPGAADVTEEVNEQMLTTDASKEIGKNSVEAIRIYETLPYVLFIIGLIGVLVGFFAPSA